MIGGRLGRQKRVLGGKRIRLFSSSSPSHRQPTSELQVLTTNYRPGPISSLALPLALLLSAAVAAVAVVLSPHVAAVGRYPSRKRRRVDVAGAPLLRLLLLLQGHPGPPRGRGAAGSGGAARFPEEVPLHLPPRPVGVLRPPHLAIGALPPRRPRPGPRLRRREADRRLLHQPARGPQDLRGLPRRPLDPAGIPRGGGRARSLHGLGLPERAQGDSRPEAARPSQGLHRRAVHGRRRGDPAAPRVRRAQEIRRRGATGGARRLRLLRGIPVRALRELQRQPQVLQREGRISLLYALQRERPSQMPRLLPLRRRLSSPLRRLNPAISGGSESVHLSGFLAGSAISCLQRLTPSPRRRYKVWVPRRFPRCFYPPTAAEAWWRRPLLAAGDAKITVPE